MPEVAARMAARQCRVALYSCWGLLGLNAAGGVAAAFRTRASMPDRRPSRAFAGGSAIRMSRARRMFLSSIACDPVRSPERFCVALSHALTRRFEHGLGRYSLCSNYLCLFLAQGKRLQELLPQLGRLAELATIFDTDELLRHSPEAFCDQIARAFAELGSSAGLRTRVIPLGGHVVAEAYYDGAWHMFDPDYDVIPSRNGVVGVGELAADPELATSAYRSNRIGNDGGAVIAMLARLNPAHVSGVDPRAGRRRRMQGVARMGKWIVPAGVLAYCIDGCQ